MEMSNVTVTVVAVTGLLVPAHAQWIHPDQQTPRTRDGKPVLTGPAPRMKGKPDLSGVWEAARPASDAPESYTGRATADPVNLQIDQIDASDIRRSVFFGMKREEEPLKPELVIDTAQHDLQTSTKILLDALKKAGRLA